MFNDVQMSEPGRRRGVSSIKDDRQRVEGRSGSEWRHLLGVLSQALGVLEFQQAIALESSVRSPDDRNHCNHQQDARDAEEEAKDETVAALVALREVNLKSVWEVQSGLDFRFDALVGVDELEWDVGSNKGA